MTPSPRLHRLSLVVAAFALAVAACGGDDPAGDTRNVTDPPGPPTTVETTESVGAGTISMRLEEVDGVFIEGFEVGLRIEDADGETIESTLWTDMVAEQGDGSLEALYETVWDVAVPTGTIVVHGTANIGMGPPPEIPDIDGEMNCSVAVDIADGDSVNIEVSFTPDDCLHVVDAA